jgi:hypothetical protein
MATLTTSTFLDLQNRVKSLLYGITWDQEQYTYLTNSIGASDTTIQVNDASQISRGLIEIDSELLNVQSFNTATNTLTIFPFGRGFYGSTAATHAANASVINNSKFPKIRVQECINDIINEVYPTLFAVKTAELNKIAVQYGYPLPTDADEILNVNYAVIGPSQIWPSMRRWRFDPNADPSNFPTGKAIHLLEEVTPGRIMRVTYIGQPSNLVNDTDEFATVTGLPETAKDCIVYGAAAKLMVAYDAARLQMDSVESSERASLTQPTSAANTSKYFMAIYQERLDLEGKKLRDRYPTYGTQIS